MRVGHILRTLDIDLMDPKSIDRAIREINKLKQSIAKVLQELTEELVTTHGVTIAKNYIVGLKAVDTGRLLGSIFGYYDEDKHIGYVVANAVDETNSDYAMYVEFGTGPNGKEGEQHPAAGEVGWQHDVGDHIYDHPILGRGWWYPGDDGRRHWTHGQVARPFMYYTLRALEDVADSVMQDYMDDI